MKFWYNPAFLAIFALIILSFPALGNLTIPNFYSSHDGETHTARIAQYWQALADGQYPPRFAGGLYSGLGSPIFVYIYPLPYIFGSFIHALGFTYTDSFEIIMALGFIFSSIFAFLWLREVFESERAAFLGALFYAWVPYRFLLIYVRGSISENTAYTFVPLLLFCLTKFAKKQKALWIGASALSFALILMSQTLVTLMTIPIIVAYILILSFTNKSFKLLIYSLISLIWGLFIAAFTYLPSLFERNFVRFDEVYSLSYLDHFVSLKQLIRSPWGYGFSVSGTGDLISFQIGFAHLLIIAFAALFLIRSFLKKPQIALMPALFFTAFFVFVILMIPTKLTLFIWEKFKPIGHVDLPWRFLGPTAIASSFLAGFLAKSVKSGLFFLLLVFAVLIANRNHLRINQTLIYDDNFFNNYHGTATHLGEFTTVWRNSTKLPAGFENSDGAQIFSGRGVISGLSARSNKISFVADIESDKAQVRINKFYFPGLIIKADGKKLELNRDFFITKSQDRLSSEEDGSGLILIDLARGKHQIIASFGETNLRLFANLLSLTSIMAVVFFLKYAKT